MYLIIWFYCPDLEGFAPSWAYFLVALLIFAYQTLDNLDGKQARRTGTSSPLGEAFDHGGDSMTVIAFAMTLGSALQFGPVLSFVTQILMMAFFYLCHWEAYFTGVLILRPLDNPTEAQFAMILLLLITCFWGPLTWLTEIRIPLLGPAQLNHIIFFFFVLSSVNTCLDNFSRVFEHYNTQQLNKTPPLLCLAPLGTLLSVSALCAWLSPALLSEHPRVFMAATGFLFSYIQIRLIIQGVCKEPFKPFYNATIPLILFAFNCFLDFSGSPIFDSAFALHLYFFVNLGNLIYLVVSVVNELTTILNIRVFTITPSTPIGSRV